MSEKKLRGRPRKYKTDEERKEARRKYDRDYRRKHREHYNKLNKLYREKRPIYWKIKKYKQSDKKYNRYIETDYIDEQWVKDELEKNSMKCHYCKCELQQSQGGNYIQNQYSIDRIDNNKGHNKDNCVISCLSCNNKRYYKIPYEEFKKQFN